MHLSYIFLNAVFVPKMKFAANSLFIGNRVIQRIKILSVHETVVYDSVQFFYKYIDRRIYENYQIP